MYPNTESYLVSEIPDTQNKLIINNAVGVSMLEDDPDLRLNFEKGG